jgi:hypothetical protein
LNGTPIFTMKKLFLLQPSNLLTYSLQRAHRLLPEATETSCDSVLNPSGAKVSSTLTASPDATRSLSGAGHFALQDLTSQPTTVGEHSLKPLSDVHLFFSFSRAFMSLTNPTPPPHNNALFNAATTTQRTLQKH